MVPIIHYYYGLLKVVRKCARKYFCKRVKRNSYISCEYSRRNYDLGCTKTNLKSDFHITGKLTEYSSCHILLLWGMVMNQEKRLKKKEKNYGIDALRMLAMFMVTVLHILTRGGILNASGRFTSQYEVGWLLQTMSFCAVNVYALISGYVWVYAKYRYRNIIELWLQVIFYTLSITILFKVFNPSSVSPVEWIKAIFPIMFNQYWYFSCYVALFLFIPLLNIILEKMEKRQLQFCIGMILFFFSGIQTLFYSDAFGTNDGYSAIWLMILYLVGGYIRKYGQSEKGKAAKFFVGYFVMIGLTWLSKLIIEIFTLHFLGEVRAGNYLISYKSPTIVLAAVCLLLFFEKIRISPFWEKMIRVFSPMAFGVYLIHVHPLIFSYLMKDRFTDYVAFPWILEIMAVLVTAVLINLICYAIEFIRLKLFEWLHIQQKLDLFEERIKEKIFK